VSDVLVGDVADVVEIETLGPTALIVHSLLRNLARSIVASKDRTRCCSVTRGGCHI